MKKVAIVHDWLTGMRGGEKCLESICDVFPEADIYTLIYIPGTVSKKIEKHKIITSFVQKFPGIQKYYRYYLPFFPKAVESFDLSAYEIVISSSHCVAKGAIPGNGALHVCYCHTPVRYVSDMSEQYFKRGKAGAVKHALLKPALDFIDRWDKRTTGRVSYFIANSMNVARRIKTRYERDAVVIYPPVDIDAFYSKREEDYYLIVSAFAPYKRVDIAIEAFNRLGKPLIVIGKGQDEKKLRKMAKPNIKFVGWVSDEKLADFYSRCRSFIFPGEEDFGITPVEAQASGKPVIAYGKGGQLETVKDINSCGKDNPTGIFFYSQDADSLIDAVRIFEEKRKLFNPVLIRENAERFNRERFVKEFRRFVEEKV